MVRVFVSHCAKHDDRSKEVLEHLVEELSDDEIELIHDHELLKVGDEWDDKLLDEIDRCDGAILLLAAASLKRSYVIKECTLLAQRKRHSNKWGGNAFALLGVFVGGVKPEDLNDPQKSHMKDLFLDRYQCATDNDLGLLVEALQAELDRLKVTCSRAKHGFTLLEEISRQLQSGKPGSDIALAKLLSIKLPPWLTRDAAPNTRAIAIATEMSEKRLSKVGKALALSKGDFEKDASVAIVNRLVPFTVPEEAAVLIPEVASSPQRKGALEINANSVETGKWYVRLAYGSMLCLNTAEVSDANAGLGAKNLYNEIFECLKEKVGVDDLEEVQIELDELYEMDLPFFVFIPGPQPVSDVIPLVYKDFPTVTLVFLTGEKVAVDYQKIKDVKRLTPLLSSGEETKAIKNYDSTLNTVEKVYGQNKKREICGEPVRLSTDF